MSLARRTIIKWIFILIAGVPILLAIALCLRATRTPPSKQMVYLPDGSRLTVNAITAGTRHAFYDKPSKRLYPLLQAIPGVPERMVDAVRPFGYEANSPILVLWCTWQQTWSTNPVPEFVFVDESGRESEALQPSGVATQAEDRPPSQGGETKGMFASGALRPKEKELRLRIYQQDRNQNRTCAGELRVRNPSYTP